MTNRKKTSSGVSLIDTLIGIFILSVAFFAIFGVFKLAVNLVLNTRARIGAAALAEDRMEFIRSLPYNDVGTQGGIPAGNLEQTENISLNGISYTRRTLILYVDASEDGEGDSDTNGITADYKVVKVEILWSIKGRSKSFFTITNIVPKGIESLAGGGTLTINAINDAGLPVADADVHIENSSTSPTISIDVSTNTSGKASFPGAPASCCYEVTVTKSGYSTAKTYSSDALNPNPIPGHLTVTEGDTTSETFAIDLLSSKTVRTFEPIGPDSFYDTFDTNGNIFSNASTTIGGGSVRLEDISGVGDEYAVSGNVISQAVEPQYLVSWNSFSWNDETPLAPTTTITYHLYYIDSSLNSVPIPDEDLAGNSAGFSGSPVDISSLDANKYPGIQPMASLATLDASTTPSVLDWSISYLEGPVPLPNISFSMRGEKIIGTDGGGSAIYKYEKNLQTNSNGFLTINNLEYDTYTITIDGSATGYDISESCPFQPKIISPGLSTTTNILLVPDSAHSLLVAVRDGAGKNLDGASVRLYRGVYDKTQTAASCGQTFFNSLSKGTISDGNPYLLDVSVSGYQNIIGQEVDVDGASNVLVPMAP